MNEREYRRLKKQITDEFQRKLEALEVVWKMSGATREGRPPKQARGAVLDAIRAILHELEEPFTSRVVLNRVSQSDSTLKRATISSALGRLVETGEIAIVEQGAGKKPSTYRRSGVVNA